MGKIFKIFVVTILFVIVTSSISGCAFYNKGYDAGYEEGSHNGYEEGYKSGKENGKETGFDKGYDIGYSNGHSDGVEVSKLWDEYNRKMN